jgi:hypothetical protein
MNLGFVAPAWFVCPDEPHEATIVMSFARVAIARSLAPNTREDGLGFRRIVAAGDVKVSEGFLRRDQ